MIDELKLSRLQRYMISNQLEILAALYPERAESLAQHRIAIECGYELLYEDVLLHIYDGDDVMGVDECKEVWDTLSMFDAIQRAVRVHGTPNEGGPAHQFIGYCGNNEAKFMAFTEYTIETLKKFNYLPIAKKKYYNSHMEVRDVYRRMLDVWLSVPGESKFDLSQSKLAEILEAATHPSRRSEK